MSNKKTALLIEELIVISDSIINSKYCRQELLAAAERLRELEIIAEFYRKEAERLAIKIGRKEKCKNT